MNICPYCFTPRECDDFCGCDGQVIAQMTTALRNIRDMARTGLKPDVMNYTELQWRQHKLNYCAGAAHAALGLVED